MKDNVRYLRVVTSPVLPVDPIVVEMAEELLRRAKAGEIQGLGYFCIESDGAGHLLGVGTAYGGEGVEQNAHGAVGAADLLRHRVLVGKLRTEHSDR